VNVKERAEALEKALGDLKAKYGNTDVSKMKIDKPTPALKVESMATSTEMTSRIDASVEIKSIAYVPTEKERERFLGFWEQYGMCVLCISTEQWEAADNLVNLLKQKYPQYQNEEHLNFAVCTLDILQWNNRSITCPDKYNDWVNIEALLDRLTMDLFVTMKHSFAFYTVSFNYLTHNLISDMTNKDGANALVYARKFIRIYHTLHPLMPSEINPADLEFFASSVLAVLIVKDGMKDGELADQILSILESIDHKFLQNSTVKIICVACMILAEKYMKSDQDKAFKYIQKTLNLPTAL